MTPATGKAIPLFPDGDAARVLLHDGETCWCAADVLATAAALAESLDSQPRRVRHLVNLAAGRDRFLVGLVAGILSDRVTLLPSTRSRGTLDDLLDEHPDSIVLHDESPDPDLANRASHLAIPPLQRALEPSATVIPGIPTNRHVARVFTSGTTGRPQGHDKHWGKLVANARAAAVALGCATHDDAGVEEMSADLHLIGTVPAQHMYGFESLVLAALCGRAVLSTAQPFFPEDIVAAIKRLPRPRRLVTTPYHLHHLLETANTLPACDSILSATAPLDVALARHGEASLDGPLQEIYGSTETGQIAIRRPTHDDGWRLLDGIRLDDSTNGDVVASGGHVERPVLLGDCIHRLPHGRFRLAGRRANQVNIAGKRSSIEHLNAILRAIDGVVDGQFFLPERPDRSTGQPQRLAAVVCAPGLTGATIRRALRERIDPVFLPRPLLRVERMPVNATGKITREALEALLERTRETEESD
ncbi:AMP-binding protein [Guyparkeria sp.]|uniref:AMP-binding protein n=1 Tax=Guyparkeria sp. TaxID=2035736 RepID=UPI003970EAE1